MSRSVRQSPHQSALERHTPDELVSGVDRPRWRASRPGRPAARRRAARWAGSAGLPTVFVALVLVVWQVLSVTGIVDRKSLPPPTKIAPALADTLSSADVWSALMQTLTAALTGLGLAFALGALLGLVIGVFPPAFEATAVLIDYLRNIPPVAIIPLVLLLYGPTTQMKVVLVVCGAMWPVLLQTLYGLRDVDPVALEVARSYRIRPLDRLRSVLLPSIVPYLLTGLRIAATLSLLMTIGTEMVTGAPGLGLSVMTAESVGEIPTMYAIVVTAAFLGFAVNLMFSLLEHAAMSWRVPQ
jgi:ABC-type nitrate/sulfonate/bicarbonate transport system permease component